MRSVIVGLSLLIALVLAGCGSQESGTTGAQDTAQPTTPSASETEEVEPAEPAEPAGGGEIAVAETLDFTGTTVDGEPFDGASLAGKPAVIWFWAPWCPTCKGQTPNISALAEEYAGEVNVVGVAGLSDDEAGIDAFAANTAGITNLTDSPGDIWRRFNITEQSVFTVLDSNGKVVSEGFLEDQELNDLVANLAG